MYVSKLFCGYKRQRNEGEKVGSEKYYNDLYPNGKKSPIFSNNEFSILVFLGLKMQDLTVRYPCFSSFFLYIAHIVWKSLKKVAFNIASEASYVYNLSGRKLIKNAKKWSIWASFRKPEAWGQTVLPDMSLLIGQKLVEDTKIQTRHFK